MREYAGEKAERMFTIIQPLVVVAEDRERAESLVPIEDLAQSSAGAEVLGQARVRSSSHDRGPRGD